MDMKQMGVMLKISDFVVSPMPINIVVVICGDMTDKDANNASNGVMIKLMLLEKRHLSKKEKMERNHFEEASVDRINGGDAAVMEDLRKDWSTLLFADTSWESKTYFKNYIDKMKDRGQEN